MLLGIMRLAPGEKNNKTHKMILQAIRAIIGLFYILFMPGFTATWVVFPRKKEIDWVERINLSLVLSLVLSVMPVMFLNFWPGIPVKTITVFFIVLVVTVIFGILAVIRWLKLK